MPNSIIPYLFKLYTEYIIWNAWMDESQTRIIIARRNVNNLRYADDTTLMAESVEELDGGKEEGKKAALKLSI